ncbi:hypothetical protein PVAND_011137 [Polypedilum vanderplanki]|uniref:Uncharacterized protein n=1 Tax=Polypedilum vanderplanki TaxID=319348 RepID=A0A9J6CIN6_POLVA|nr:hypothetical protein PVAND_011137 [Polypedilum vanderplanki]
MNKLIFFAFIVLISYSSYAQSGVFKGFVDDSIYGAIQVVLRNQYPHEPEKTDCMIADFRRNKVADQFYTTDLLFDQDKLTREIQPYVDEANLKCTLIQFFQSPLGICVLIALFLLAIAIICCLIRCICC